MRALYPVMPHGKVRYIACSNRLPRPSHWAVDAAVDHHFPDERLLAHGLGLADVLAQRPMTIFPAADDLFFRREVPALAGKRLSEESLHRTDSSTQLRSDLAVGPAAPDARLCPSARSGDWPRMCGFDGCERC